MSQGPRGARRRAVAAAIAVAVVAGGLGGTAAVSGASPAAPATRRSTAASGIGASWTTAQGSWATVPMGHLHSAENTFWELLFRPMGSTRWTLVTPPGVASNGGIVGVSTPVATATVTVGFQPAKYLLYSPVARTTDEGKKWFTGTLPAGLAQVADAMASGTGLALALERAKGGTLVRSSGSLTRWSTVTTARALAATEAGAACGLTALSAVAVTSGTPVVGGDCAKPGVVGLFTDAGGSWQAAGPTVPAESSATMRVVRLSATPSGTAALVEARSKSEESLVALWRGSGSQAWSVSAPAHVDGRVLSADVGAGGSMIVVTSTGSKATEVHALPSAGAPWTSTPAPEGTQAVVGGPGAAASGLRTGELTALAISNSWVTVWDRAGGSWSKGLRFKVPIEYGSST